MLTKNQIYEATVTDYTSEGQGVAHIDGCAVFIPNAIAGEVYKVRIEVAKKNWAAGKIVEKPYPPVTRKLCIKIRASRMPRKLKSGML
jgi:23S rRNA (uracil1939-C5)-methyltransferase